MLCSFGVFRILSLKFGGKFKIIGGDRYTFNLFLQESPMIVQYALQHFQDASCGLRGLIETVWLATCLFVVP